MIQSMTGFGKATGEYNGKKIVIEVKSLNSKQMDISTRITGAYREKEIELRNDLSQALERGKIDLSLYVDNSGKEGATQINSTIVESYYQQIKSIAGQHSIEMPSNWFEIILRLPEVMKSETSDLDENEWKLVKSIMKEALIQIKMYRVQEGKSLELVFRQRIDDIRNLLLAIEPFESERIDRIKTRLEENLQNISEKFDYDNNRLEQELIFYIEKIDVNEEKVRLRTHLDYFIQ
ncbi:MAG: YicC/YloC family endoribonuclease, partial [Ignavibacteria bacterium]|nr:YicC/YloC family endoribonuclease [Ignavibacteria bacterium]